MSTSTSDSSSNPSSSSSPSNLSSSSSSSSAAAASSSSSEVESGIVTQLAKGHARNFVSTSAHQRQSFLHSSSSSTACASSSSSSSKRKASLKTKSAQQQQQQQDQQTSQAFDFDEDDGPTRVTVAALSHAHNHNPSSHSFYCVPTGVSVHTSLTSSPSSLSVPSSSSSSSSSSAAAEATAVPTTTTTTTSTTTTSSSSSSSSFATTTKKSTSVLEGDDEELVAELRSLETANIIEEASVTNSTKSESESTSSLLEGVWDLCWSGSWTPSQHVELILYPNGKLLQTQGNYTGKWWTVGHILVLDYCCLSLPGGTKFQAEVNDVGSCFRGLRTQGYTPYAMYVAEKVKDACDFKMQQQNAGWGQWCSAS